MNQRKVCEMFEHFLGYLELLIADTYAFYVASFINYLLLASIVVVLFLYRKVSFLII